MKRSERLCRSKMIYLRKKLGYTQKQLADIVGVSTVTISRYEDCHRNPTIKTAIDIKKALGYSGDDLFAIEKVTIPRI